jgi:hypothetical protein
MSSGLKTSFKKAPFINNCRNIAIALIDRPTRLLMSEIAVNNGCRSRSVGLSRAFVLILILHDGIILSGFVWNVRCRLPRARDSVRRESASC